VRTLSAEDRALVLLRYLHDFEATELAEMTGATPSVRNAYRAPRSLAGRRSPPDDEKGATR